MNSVAALETRIISEKDILWAACCVLLLFVIVSCGHVNGFRL